MNENLDQLQAQEEEAYTTGDYPRASKLRAERMKRKRKDNFGW